MQFLKEKLLKSEKENTLRKLSSQNISDRLIDFCSNDYLGVVKNKLIKRNQNDSYGSTGSRLISGNSPAKEKIESQIAKYHNSENALIFNSGYDANLGLLSCIGVRGSTIIYDEFIHASTRDGIRLSFAYSMFFKHNDLEDLENKLKKSQGNTFVAIESLYSMDGDFADIEKINSLCDKYSAYLVVDEAHSFGVFGENGIGCVQSLKNKKQCLAVVYTYGKACGYHGASVVGSNLLIQYLINFCRPFIFSTAMPDESFHKIYESYSIISSLEKERSSIKELVNYFSNIKLRYEKIKSNSPIQGIKINDISLLLRISSYLKENNFSVSPIRYPTVPKGEERLRIILHSFNTKEEVNVLSETINRFY